HPLLPMLPHLQTAPAPAEIDTLSLHDALPILGQRGREQHGAHKKHAQVARAGFEREDAPPKVAAEGKGNDAERDEELKACAEQRSEEHTSELQSRENLVCRLLLEKKKKTKKKIGHNKREEKEKMVLKEHDLEDDHIHVNDAMLMEQLMRDALTSKAKDLLIGIKKR